MTAGIFGEQMTRLRKLSLRTVDGHARRNSFLCTVLNPCDLVVRVLRGRLGV